MKPAILALLASSIILAVLRSTLLPHLPAGLLAALSALAGCLGVIEILVWASSANDYEDDLKRHYEPSPAELDAARQRAGQPDTEASNNGVQACCRPCENGPLCPICQRAAGLLAETDNLTGPQFVARADAALKVAFATPAGYVAQCHPAIQCPECNDERPTTRLPRADDTATTHTSRQALAMLSPSKATVDDLARALHWADTNQINLATDGYEAMRSYYYNLVRTDPLGAYRTWQLWQAAKQTATARQTPPPASASPLLLLAITSPAMDHAAYGIMGLVLTGIILGLVYAWGYGHGSRDTSADMRRMMRQTQATMLVATPRLIAGWEVAAADMLRRSQERRFSLSIH
jgi:hypothetical protein